MLNETQTTCQYESLRTRVARTELKSADVIKDRLGITNLKLNLNGRKQEQQSQRQDEYSHLSDGQEAHWEVVERILFIFSKLNPGISYVQGMNEICGPIYYTFATDPDPEWRSNILLS
jgi:TBC1 domain family member 13